MPRRSGLALGCFGFGVFFAILAVHIDPTLAARNPPAWCLAFMGLFATAAIVSLVRRA